MTRATRLASLAAVAIFGSACFRTVINTPAAAGPAYGEDVEVSWLALSTATTDAKQCTYGIARATAYLPFWGWLVYGVTIGIVAPMRMQYQCAAGASNSTNVAPPMAQPLPGAPLAAPPPPHPVSPSM
jgi:hypothetical protein